MVGSALQFNYQAVGCQTPPTLNSVGSIRKLIYIITLSELTVMV
ncbi:hypothetical protein O9993_17935 [Vibrio lentus]|nr:hypothetical protein [Vibrio lentus]